MSLPVYVRHAWWYVGLRVALALLACVVAGAAMAWSDHPLAWALAAVSLVELAHSLMLLARRPVIRLQQQGITWKRQSASWDEVAEVRASWDRDSSRLPHSLIARGAGEAVIELRRASGSGSGSGSSSSSAARLWRIPAQLLELRDVAALVALVSEARETAQAASRASSA